MQSQELLALRAQIDALDEELVVLLARRFRVTDAVGALKAAEGLSAVDPDREAAQEQRLAHLALRHEVNPSVVNRIFRTIVEEVVSSHMVIASRLSRSE